jgi:hypothetical protein
VTQFSARPHTHLHRPRELRSRPPEQGHPHLLPSQLLPTQSRAPLLVHRGG